MSPAARIIVMSRNAGESHVADLARLGVARVLIKPFSAVQLAEALQALSD